MTFLPAGHGYFLSIIRVDHAPTQYGKLGMIQYYLYQLELLF
jgi:hypothetical protein